MIVHYSYSELPCSSQADFESWWSANEQYGQRKPSNTKTDFVLLDVPHGHVTEEMDSPAPDWYHGVRRDVDDWCRDTLSGWWSPRRFGNKNQMIFSSVSDMLVYKLRWLDNNDDD